MTFSVQAYPLTFSVCLNTCIPRSTASFSCSARFLILSIEIDKSRMASEEFLVIGDLNSKIAVDDAGGTYDETPNGKLLLIL